MGLPGDEPALGRQLRDLLLRVASNSQQGRFIWDWWDFAFLPIPPRSLADLERIFWHVLNIFNSPAWVVTPLGVLGSAFVALGLYSIGRYRWAGGGAAVFICCSARCCSRLSPRPCISIRFMDACSCSWSPRSICWSAKGRRRSRAAAVSILTVALAAFLLVQPAEERALESIGPEAHSWDVRLARRPPSRSARLPGKTRDEQSQRSPVSQGWRVTALIRAYWPSRASWSEAGLLQSVVALCGAVSRPRSIADVPRRWAPGPAMRGHRGLD